MQETDSAPVEVEHSTHLRNQETQSVPDGPRDFVSAASSRRVAPLNSNCIVCGETNPSGLQLTFETGSTGVHAMWIPSEKWESFHGTVHGGIITAVLDEAMSKAIIGRGWEALTVELRMRFRGRVCPGDELRVHGWIVEKRKRRILAEARLTAFGGRELAHAWATFLVPQGSI